MTRPGPSHTHAPPFDKHDRAKEADRQPSSFPPWTPPGALCPSYARCHRNLWGLVCAMRPFGWHGECRYEAIIYDGPQCYTWYYGISQTSPCSHPDTPGARLSFHPSFVPFDPFLLLAASVTRSLRAALRPLTLAAGSPFQASAPRLLPGVPYIRPHTAFPLRSFPYLAPSLV
jgi:hypothetical protein